MHEDLLTLSEGDGQGREADYTSENILRASIVQHLEGLPFREAVIRIGSDPFLQDFLRMRKRPVMDYSFLDRCFLAIQPQTWRRVNELLGQYGVREEMVSPNAIRTDTTVVESNIHYPTDASLLWDTWRVASRLLTRAREIAPQSVPHRFHDRKIKRLYLYVIRYLSSPSKPRQRKVKSGLPHLDRADGVDRGHCRGIHGPKRQAEEQSAAALALELKAYVPSMVTVVVLRGGADRRARRFRPRKRVFSLFEAHTELIKRGKRQKAVEFGHKVLLCESIEKFITDYEVYQSNSPTAT